MFICIAGEKVTVQYLLGMGLPGLTCKKCQASVLYKRKRVFFFFLHAGPIVSGKQPSESDKQGSGSGHNNTLGT